MNLSRVAVPLLLACLVGGCASTSRVMLGQAYAPTDPAQVRIYTTPPPGSVEIAQLSLPARSVSARKARPMPPWPASSAKPRRWVPMAWC